MGKRSVVGAKPKGGADGSKQERTGETNFGCDHTLHLVDSDGRQTGSWIGETTTHGTRFSCSGCGKFYGYLPKKNQSTDVSSG